MSFLGDLFGFGGGDSAEDAARIQAQASIQSGQLSADASIQSAEIQERQTLAAIEEIQRQFGETQAGFAPFLEAGIDVLPSLRRGAGTRGFDRRIGKIQDTDIFGNLVEERTRAVQGQLAAGGLTRSGTALNEIADIPSDLALKIENLLFNRKANIVASGQNAAAGLGGFGAQSSGNIAELLQALGISEGQGVTGAATATGQGITGSAAATASGILDSQTANEQASQNVLNAAATIASIFPFSDPRLKENVKEIGQIRDLQLYQWDWIPETKGTIIETYPTIGFMADQVLDKYPTYIQEFGGFMTINYSALLNELEAKAWPLH